MTVDLRRSGKIASSWESGGCTWKILKREGLWVLVEGKPSTGGVGPKRYAVCSICQDDGNKLFCRPDVAVNDLDKNSPFLSLEQMTAVYERKAQEERGRASKATLQAKEQERINEAILSWRDKLDLIRLEQSKLIDELKEINASLDDKVVNSKRVSEICNRLSVIEQYLHHGRPRTVSPGAVG